MSLRAVILTLVSAGALAAFPVPKAAQAPSIAGTSWTCDGIVGLCTYTFNADGTLFYLQKGELNKSGTWTQNDDRIYLEFNRKYCEFEGILAGDEIKGRVWNVANFRKEIAFSRVGEK